MHALDEPTQQQWDAIIVGAGLGGATIGHALAKAGHKVLFCEKGKATPALRGTYPEQHLTPPFARVEDRAHLANAGRCWEEITDLSGKRSSRHIPFIGAGAGGSSALYGMVLERFFPEDFHPQELYPAAQDADLPVSWPFSYQELAPWYAAAEALFRVSGTRDPMRGEDLPPLPPPPALEPNQQALFDHFVTRGLHPYHLPLACERVPGCLHCQSYLCPHPCKNDSARVCLTPAIDEHGAQVLDECRVLGLEADKRRVTGVVCEWQGRRLTLRAKQVILAAGALYTPAILLRSSGPDWPQGLANGSGLVGRNLMRHYVDLYLVDVGINGDNRDKAIGLNDFYHRQGRKLGTVQSFGALPPATMLVESLQDDLRHSALPILGSLIAPFKPILRAVLGRLTQRLIVASLMEDLPYRENRVWSEAEGVAFSYRLSGHERQRIRDMRRTLGQVLSGLSPTLIKQAENNQRLAHVCGTCRAGTDPGQSVVDKNCRAHDLDNLYIADASFFPSSGGSNPALTIVANALRVADRITANG